MTPGTGTAAALSEEGKGFLFKFVLIFSTSFSTFSTFSSTCRTPRLKFLLALATIIVLAITLLLKKKTGGPILVRGGTSYSLEAVKMRRGGVDLAVNGEHLLASVDHQGVLVGGGDDVQ